MFRYVKHSLYKLLKEEDEQRDNASSSPEQNSPQEEKAFRDENEEEENETLWTTTQPTTPRRENESGRRRRRVLTAVADLQGFWIGRQFIIKVLTVIRAAKDDPEERFVQKFTFRPPRPFYTLNSDDKRQVWWIKSCHHATPPWSSGRYDYRDRTFVMLNAFEGVTTIYVKGAHKKEWLLDVIQGKHIVDLESIGCPPLKECLRAYRELYACGDVSLAGQHVIALYDWMSVNRPHLLHHEVETRKGRLCKRSPVQGR
ncbi:hypothetical protein R5R35_000092 [Gryllus longicercus]|uniref:Uncharacterized protein n=1 Tax=Gryllus longicercus TaxID=2509291 RepID=A0AAN9Z5R4_9ORTH